MRIKKQYKLMNYRSSVDFRERIAHLEGTPHFHLHYADLGDSMSVLGVIGKVRPDEI